MFLRCLWMIEYLRRLPAGTRTSALGAALISPREPLLLIRLRS